MITVVSGLPRSGTSLMMQMLEKGGMPVLTDGFRKADIRNPRGYYEYEKVKSLARDNGWMAEAEGKAVKIIAQLLLFLPSDHEYKIVFMERPMNAVLRSQEKMLGRPAIGMSGMNERLAATFEEQLKKVRNFISASPGMSLLTLNFEKVILNPDAAALEINTFLGGTLDVKAMAKAADPALWHERQAAGSS